jgi:hypothetical protein
MRICEASQTAGGVEEEIKSLGKDIGYTVLAVERVENDPTEFKVEVIAKEYDAMMQSIQKGSVRLSSGGAEVLFDSSATTATKPNKIWYNTIDFLQNRGDVVPEAARIRILGGLINSESDLLESNTGDRWLRRLYRKSVSIFCSDTFDDWWKEMKPRVVEWCD